MTKAPIELDSGEWSWRVTQLEGGSNPYTAGARPAGTADPDPSETVPTVLLLEDPEDPGHWMARELPRDTREEELSEDEIVALARDPDRRQLSGPEGEIWRVDRIDEPEPIRPKAEFERSRNEVRVSSGGGPEQIVPLPDDRPLGTLRRGELLDVIQANDKRRSDGERLREPDADRRHGIDSSGPP